MRSHPQMMITEAPKLSSLMRSRTLMMTSEAPEFPPAREAGWNPMKLPIPFSAFADKVPPYLDGRTYAGDVGFDPLCLVALANPSNAAVLASDRSARLDAMSQDEQQYALAWMREAELKHARLAMMAAAGWPLAELANGSVLRDIGTNGRAPSLLNGGLLDIPSCRISLLFAFGFASFVELNSFYYGLTGGDYDFDPLGISSGEGAVPRTFPNVGNGEQLSSAEIKHGRLAMMAVTGYVVQEVLWGNPVVEQTPWFFGR